MTSHLRRLTAADLTSFSKLVCRLQIYAAWRFETGAFLPKRYDPMIEAVAMFIKTGNLNPISIKAQPIEDYICLRAREKAF